MNERRRSGVFVRSATFHLAAPINRRQVVMVVVVLSPGSIPRVTELPKGREERRRGLRSDPSSLLLLSRIISPPLPRDKLPRGAAPSLPPSSFLSLPLPLSLSLSSLLHPRPTDRATDQYDTASADTVGPLLLQITTEREEKREREREGGRGKTAL